MATEKVQQTKPVHMRLNELVVVMSNELMAEKGYSSMRAVVEEAIRMMHAKVFPIYAQSKRRPEGTTAAQKENEEREEQLALVKKLNGTIEEIDGVEMCVFFNYHKKRRLEQRLPVDRLSDVLVRNQYVPSREAVEKLQKEGKVEYEV